MMEADHLNVPQKGMAAYRAPSLCQPHKARQALRDAYDGKIARLIGYYCGLCDIAGARIIAQLGADFVWVDWEHASCNVETMTDIVHTIQFMSEGRTMPFVRLPGHDHAAIGYALDAGASIVVPHVDTVAQAQHVAAATKFGDAHGGTRSAPPTRWLSGLSDATADPTRSIWENVNDQAAVIIQVECREAVDNLDAILSSVGHHFDAVWMGTLDMRASMGLEGIWGEEPEFRMVVKQFEDTLRKHDKPNAGPCFDGAWDRAANKMFTVVAADFMTLAADKSKIETARENLGPLKGKGW